MSEDQRGALVAILIFLALAVAIAWRFFYRSGPEPKRERVAIIQERIEATAGGSAATLLLVVSNLFVIGDFVASTNILQQNVAINLWIGCNVLFGLGVAVGRRRTYVVLRTPPDDDQRRERPTRPPEAEPAEDRVQ
jgi:hypothetical protein